MGYSQGKNKIGPITLAQHNKQLEQVRQRAAAQVKQARALAAAVRSTPAKKTNPAKVTLRSNPSKRQYMGYAAARGGLLKGASSYMSMVLNPHQAQEDVAANRYPDETIVPTSIVSLQDTISYTQPAQTGDSIDGTMVTALRWKVCNNTSETTFSEAPILPPQFSTLGAQPSSRTSTFQVYANQLAWNNVTASDRTLAMGIRVRLNGYPNNNFYPSGTLYFLQLQNHEIEDFYYSLRNGPGVVPGEAYCRSAVTAKKGFSCTTSEIASSAGVTIPYLPQGPMSYTFSDSNSSSPVLWGIPQVANAGNISSNGCVVVAGFGLQPGLQLKFDYAHVIEYIPSASASGLISTAVMPPNASARDAIAHGVANVQRAIAGSTTYAHVRPYVADAARVAAPAIMGAVNGYVRGGFPGAAAGIVSGGMHGARLLLADG